MSEILCQGEMFVDVGSTINITCVVEHAPGPLQWMHSDEVGRKAGNSNGD